MASAPGLPVKVLKVVLDGPWLSAKFSPRGLPPRFLLVFSFLGAFGTEDMAVPRHIKLAVEVVRSNNTQDI